MKTSRRDSKEDREMQERIRLRANYSLAILGAAFVRHGSGRFLWLGPPPSIKDSIAILRGLKEENKTISHGEGISPLSKKNFR